MSTLCNDMASLPWMNLFSVHSMLHENFIVICPNYDASIFEDQFKYSSMITRNASVILKYD